ncbi:MAG: response regulator [Candidatus Binatia bacterium]
MTKALVIYDHPGMIDVLTRQLEKLGFAVILVDGGMEGVEKAITEKPDLIIIDTLLSGIDAQEATRRIRSNQATKDILILATTAITKKSQLRECVEGVYNDYIVKPFTSNQLVPRIEKLFMTALETISGAKVSTKGATTAAVLGWGERVVLRDVKRLANKAAEKTRASRPVDPGIVKEPRPVGLTEADGAELPRESREPPGATPPPGSRPGQPPPGGPGVTAEVIELTEVV